MNSGMHQVNEHIYTDEQIIIINRIFHDIEADIYDDLYFPLISEEGRHWKYLLDFVMPLFPIDKDRTIIDFGCGTGLISSILFRYIKENDKLICIDLSTKMLHKASLKMANIISYQEQQKDITIEYLCSDTIPLFDENHVLIAMNSVLHHIPDPQKLLKQFARLLQIGGVVMFAHEPNRRAYNNNLIQGLSKGRTYLRNYLSRIDGPNTLNITNNYTNLVAEEVNKSGLLPWKVTVEEIVQVANVQVPHENKPRKMRLGFDLEEIQSWLPGFNMIYWSTKGYLGTYASPKKSIQILEYLLSKIYPMDGRLLTGVFQKQ